MYISFIAVFFIFGHRRASFIITNGVFPSHQKLKVACILFIMNILLETCSCLLCQLYPWSHRKRSKKAPISAQPWAPMPWFSMYYV